MHYQIRLNPKMTSSINRKQERRIRTFSFLILFLFFSVSAMTFGFFGALIEAVAMTILLAILIITSLKWMIADKKGIPILTFHSVSTDNQKTVSPYLTLPVSDFSNMLGLLYKKGYQSIRLNEVQDHIDGRIELKGKVFAITFDDGYRDNWVFAYPVMKKFKFSGTLFTATDFIKPEIDTRQSPPPHIPARGYLTIEQLQEMENSGLFQIESHTAAHTWLFTDDNISDFIKPDDYRSMWMLWNDLPAEKHSWYVDFETKQKKIWGSPVFNFSRSHLVQKAYFPDTNLLKSINTYVIEKGGKSFFNKAEWKHLLNEKYLTLLQRWPGKWENDRISQKRKDQELGVSKQKIETWLNKKVRYLCWPGDIFTPELHKDAIKTYGYKATTGGQGRNTKGEDPTLFSRIYVKHRYVPFRSATLNKYLFYAEVRSFEGNFYYYIICLIANMFNNILYLVHYKELKARKT